MGGALSFNSAKMLGCAIALPILIAVATKMQLEAGGQAIIWLLGLGLVVGIFVFMNALLTERGQPWTFMLPGSLMLGAAAFVIAVLAIFTSGTPSNLSGLYIALMLASFCGALWYNIKGLGLGDGIVITLMQLCLALVVVAVVLAWYFFVPDHRRR